MRTGLIDDRRTTVSATASDDAFTIDA